MTTDMEMAREEVLRADSLYERGLISYDEYIEEINEINRYYGTDV